MRHGGCNVVSVETLHHACHDRVAERVRGRYGRIPERAHCRVVGRRGPNAGIAGSVRGGGVEGGACHGNRRGNVAGIVVRRQLGRGDVSDLGASRERGLDGEVDAVDDVLFECLGKDGAAGVNRARKINALVRGRGPQNGRDRVSSGTQERRLEVRQPVQVALGVDLQFVQGPIPSVEYGCARTRTQTRLRDHTDTVTMQCAAARKHSPIAPSAAGRLTSRRVVGYQACRPGH